MQDEVYNAPPSEQTWGVSDIFDGTEQLLEAFISIDEGHLSIHPPTNSPPAADRITPFPHMYSLYCTPRSTTS